MAMRPGHPRETEQRLCLGPLQRGFRSKMRRNALRLALATGAFAIFGLASASLAQEVGPPPPPAEHADHAAEMSQHLRDILQLRPDQQPVLDAFIAAVQPPMDLKNKVMRDMQEDRALPTPERLDHMLAHIDEVRAMLVTRVEAT